MASAYKTLSRSEQWDDWIDQTRLYMEQLELWRFMDTERVFGLGESRPKEPTEPLLPSYDEALEARCAETPTDAQKKILYRLELHKTFGATYDSFLKRKEKAIKYLTTYVDARWQHVLSGCSTLLEKMQALEENVAPKLETRKNTLRLKFASMQKGKPSNTSMITHLHQWSLLDRRMKTYDMPERHSLPYAFSRSIAAYHEGIYNMIRAAGDIARDELPPLNTMIQIVRTEISARSLNDNERQGGSTKSRSANATYQDNDDANADDDENPSPPSPSTTENKNSGKRESSTAREKKKSKNKRDNRGGCGFVTKKPTDKQCASLQDCDVANGQLWPDEQDRTAEWKKALKNYKQYCKENKSFCERSANTFKNPAAIEVWQQHHGGDKEEKFVGTTIRAVSSASQHHQDRRAHWLYDNCANSHVLNDVRRVQYEITELPEDSYIAAGSDNFQIVAVGTCKLRVPRIDGGFITLVLLDVPYVPGFHTNIVSELKLHKAGLWYHGRESRMYHDQRPISDLVRRADGLPCFDLVTPLADNRPAITEWPRRPNGSPMTVNEAYGQESDVPFAASTIIASPSPSKLATIEPPKPAAEPSTLVTSAPSKVPEPSKLVASSYQPSQRKVTPTLLHRLLGHAGADRIDHVENNVRGITVVQEKHALAPKVHECPHCAVAKSQRVPSRVTRERLEIPLAEMAIDLVQLGPAFNDDRWLIHAYDLETHLHFGTTTPTKSQKVIMRFLHELSTFCARIGKPMRVLHGDNDPSYAQDLTTYLRENEISWQTTAIYTPAQDPAERAGGVIISTARAMRVSSGLPHELWPEIVKAAMYLLNRTPVKEKGWKTPFELATGRPPRIGHLRVFGCRAYAHKLGTDQPPRLEKLAERAHIGYLVGWDSSNIYRIWAPSLDTVLRTRDVVFDERRFFDPHDLDLLHAASTSELAAEGVLFLEDDDEESERSQFWELEAESAITDESHDGEITHESHRGEHTHESHNGESAHETGNPTQNHEHELVEYEFPPGLVDDPDADQILGDPDLTPPLTPPGAATQRDEPHQLSDDDLSMIDVAPLATAGTKRMHDSGPDDDPNNDDHDEKRLRALALHRIIAATCLAASKFTHPDAPTRAVQPSTSRSRAAMATSTLANSNQLRLHVSTMPKEPEHFGQVRKSKFREQWEHAMAAEFDNAIRMGTFRWVAPTSASLSTGKPLPLKWVFKYKTDSGGFVERFKARLCARGDLQATSQDTYASTLAMRVFRLMCAIAAHFDLEMIQMDAVNAYLNAELSHEIHLQTPPGINAPEGCTLSLLRALYGLKESGFLWQQMLQRALEDLGLRQVPGVECLYTDGYLTFFFFVDDMVLVYHKRHQDRADRFTKGLMRAFEIKQLGDLAWYLGIKVTRDRATKELWLSQTSYIKKIASTFEIQSTTRKTRTPLPAGLNLLPPPTSHEASSVMVKAYQRRTGSIAYAALATRADVAHAASLLSCYNRNPAQEHMKAADHCIRYLLEHAGHALHFGANTKEVSMTFHRHNFAGASDASFADDRETRCSSEGMIFHLFGTPIDWKAARQKTVTKSSTDAELLAISHAGSEMIWWQRLFGYMQLRLDEPTLYCDNMQTLRVIKNAAARAKTALRHVDIHQCWIRQQHERGNLKCEWVETSKMPADGLTKIFGPQQHATFLQQLSIVEHEHDD